MDHPVHLNLPAPYRRAPDFERLRRVLCRQGQTFPPPLYEHIASPGFVSSCLGRDVRALTGPAFWREYVAFWRGLGFDAVPLEVPLDLPPLPADRPVPVAQSEAGARIRGWGDFEELRWPPLSAPIDLEPFETVAGLLPEGMKIVAGVGGGPFECASQALFGLMGLCYALVDTPDLVAAVFEKLDQLYVSAVRQLASLNAVGACRQGDDLGYKTATFLDPETLRRLVLPIYTEMAAVSHARDKPFLLHSCGNLEAIHEDLIDCGIDAKHSFEDQILPVAAFQRRFGNRITPLGGLDVDVLCRSDESTLRRYVREVTRACLEAGHWALGSGNSLPDFLPVEHYLLVLDEAARTATTS